MDLIQQDSREILQRAYYEIEALRSLRKDTVVHDLTKRGAIGLSSLGFIALLICNIEKGAVSKSLYEDLQQISIVFCLGIAWLCFSSFPETTLVKQNGQALQKLQNQICFLDHKLSNGSILTSASPEIESLMCLFNDIISARNTNRNYIIAFRLFFFSIVVSFLDSLTTPNNHDDFLKAYRVPISTSLLLLPCSVLSEAYWASLDVVDSIMLKELSFDIAVSFAPPQAPSMSPAA